MSTSKKGHTIWMFVGSAQAGRRAGIMLWLFVGSPQAGRRAGIMLSLIVSCKDNRVEPWAYLRDLFAELPKLPDQPQPADLQPLLPDRWLAAHPQHRWTIADVRAEERLAKGDL